MVQKLNEYHLTGILKDLAILNKDDLTEDEKHYLTGFYSLRDFAELSYTYYENGRIEVYEEITTLQQPAKFNRFHIYIDLHDRILVSEFISHYNNTDHVTDREIRKLPPNLIAKFVQEMNEYNKAIGWQLIDIKKNAPTEPPADADQTEKLRRPI